MTNNPQNPATNVLHSGLGASRVLVSPGAEEFDPDSLLDEPEPLSQDPEEINKRALALAPKPFLVLTLSPPLATQPLQVAGFLHKLNSNKHYFALEFECLTVLALAILELPLANDRTAFSGCEIRTKGQEPVKLEFGELFLEYVNIEDMVGSKAVVRLHFSRAEQGM